MRMDKLYYLFINLFIMLASEDRQMVNGRKNIRSILDDKKLYVGDEKKT